MLISDWSSDVCSADLVSSSSCPHPTAGDTHVPFPVLDRHRRRARGVAALGARAVAQPAPCDAAAGHAGGQPRRRLRRGPGAGLVRARSEEHTSELQSLMRISYAVFCLKKKRNTKI